MESIECKGTEHMFSVLPEIEAKGGNGIIVSNPNGYYYQPNSVLQLQVTLLLLVIY